MKAPFKPIAGVLIAVGLLTAVAVVVLRQPLLGLDLGAAATLVIGGCVLWALNNAINLLRLTREELRRQRKAGTPPWLRDRSAKSAAKAAASAAPPQPEAAPAEAVRQEVGEQPMVTAAARQPTAAAATEPAEAPEPEPEMTAAPEPAEPEAAPVRHDRDTEERTAAAQPAQEPQAEEPAGLAETAAAPPDEQAQRPPEPERAEMPAGPEQPEAPAEAPSAPQPDEPALPGVGAELDETDELAQAVPEDAVELYVVEERMFRGKPARVLSDGTIESETDEGWMRFEDFDHLREYMDAMAALRPGR